MIASESKLQNEDQARQLIDVFCAISSVKDMNAFVRDVMTEKEINELSARLQAARMLKTGVRYSDISAETKLSSRTIARISEWLKNGTGGYQIAFETLGAHHSHTLPARAK